MPYRTRETPEPRWIDDFDVENEVVRDLLRLAELADTNAFQWGQARSPYKEAEARNRATSYREKARELSARST